jgi:4-amino-4-deoxy-L-arabinose transferase-like glycosyltransferase
MSRLGTAAPRAWFLEVAVLVVAIAGLLWLVRVNSTDTAGGSDSYGYVSEALLLSQGHLSTPEQVLSRFGLPENSDLRRPLGYLPRDATRIIPSYPFGFPLLLAAFIRLGGLATAFWLTAVLAAGGALFTYLLGRSQLGRFGGIIAACLFLLLPSFIYGAIQPMSDVPATCFAALALLALLGMKRGRKQRGYPWPGRGH